MGNKNMNLMNYRNREFYIVDCKDFTYFARKIHVIGFEMSPDELVFITNTKDRIFNEHRKMHKEELEQFKSFEEASSKAKQLNEMPENKKRAEQWLKDKQTILEMQYYFR